MENIFIFTLAVYGISAAFVYFSGPFGIIDKFRDWVKNNLPETFSYLLSCMFCLPVNVGGVLSVISLVSGTYFTPFTNFLGDTNCWLLAIVLDGAYCGGVVSIIDGIVESMINKVDIWEEKSNLTES